MRVVFNTHRGYAAEGQIIVIEHVADEGNDNVWAFNDTTRDISGRVKVDGNIPILTASQAARAVMRRYDAGGYEGTVSSEAPQRKADDVVISVLKV